MSEYKLNKYDVVKVLTFISSMKKTGKNVVKSLEFYAEKIAKEAKLKQAIDSTVYELSSGGRLEETLLKNGFINKFQYAILKVSNDKNKAFENILKFDKNKSEASLFYGKKLLIFTLVYVGLFMALPFANDFFSDILTKLTQHKPDYVMGGYVKTVLGLNDYYRPFAVILLLCSIGLVLFYNSTYQNNLPMHYKFFRYRAMVDATQFFQMMEDLLKSELTVVKSLSLLSEYNEPKSSRFYISKIQESIEHKNQPEFENNLRKFYINDFAIFTLLSSLEIGDLKRGFSNALVNTEDFNKVEIEKQKEIIDLIAFFLNTLLVGATVLYFVLLEGEIAFQ